MPSPAEAPAEAESGLAYAGIFSAALADPVRPVPDGLAGPAGGKVDRRFGVYRNNVAVGFANALAGLFPATARIVGDDFFRAMVRPYLRACPPRSRLLTECGAGLGDFVAGFAPLGDFPWLADVVRIEQAWIEAYHAADAPPLAADALAAVTQEMLGGIVLEPHPAARIVRSAFPAVTIFSANREAAQADNAGMDINLGMAEDALVTRPKLEVVVTRLPAGGATFLDALIGGASLMEAAARASDGAGFDLAANIHGMIEAGVFTTIGRSGKPEETGEIR
jgi:hypothetical protein